jgi:hypothetical protein
MPAYILTYQQSLRATDLLWAWGRCDVTTRALVEEIIYLRDEVDSLRAFKAGVDDALNSGDGVYRP